MKHLSKHTLFIVTLIFPVTVIGCGGQKRPAGFPARVIPVNVIVAKNGDPLSEIGVYFDLENPANYQIGGTTDSSGIAVMRTIQSSYQKNGVPEGTYRVRLTESIPPMPDELSDAAYQALSPSALKAYEKRQQDWGESQRKIPPKFSETDSPLSVTVNNSSDNITIDVAQ